MIRYLRVFNKYVVPPVSRLFKVCKKRQNSFLGCCSDLFLLISVLNAVIKKGLPRHSVKIDENT